MEIHSFIDFQADRLPNGITALHRVRQEGYVLGEYLLEPCAGAKLGSPQLTLIQHQGDPFILHWQPVDHDQSTQHLVRSGQVHLTPPERIVEVSWSEQQHVFILAMDVGFLTNGACQGTTEMLDSMPAQLDIQDAAILTILDILKDSCRRRSLPLASQGLACAHVGVLLLERYSGKQPRAVIAGGLGVSRQRRILSFIESHLHEDLSLERLAAAVDLSSDHFGRAFRASLGTTPLRYVSDRRVQRAKAMLLDPSVPITAIAMALGYATPSHFTESFHKATGTTPSQWRRDRR